MAEIADLVFTPLESFAAIDEPGADAIATAADGSSVIPADGTVLVYGDGGAGKTTITIDLAFKLAAGEPWLDLVNPSRPVRVLVIEAEGPRQEFRRKLERKLAHHGTDTLDGRVLILEDPWAEFSFADEAQRRALALAIVEHDADLLVVGPVASVGMVGGGTPDEIRAFEQLLRDVRARLERPLAILLVHHENRAGQVSGAWERVPDTLLHVIGQGHGRTRICWQKARHSSALHGTTTQLVWADGESFTVEAKPEVSDDTIAAGLLAAVREHPGSSWEKIRNLRDGKGNKRVRGNLNDLKNIRDRLIAEGTLVQLSAPCGPLHPLAARRSRAPSFRAWNDAGTTDVRSSGWRG